MCETDPDLRPGWTLVCLPHRLWASIPDRERVTERDVDPTRATAPRMLEVLRKPECDVAVRWELGWHAAPNRRHLWGPCRGQVHGGAARCSRHGGPRPKKVLQETLDALERENALLRQELAKVRSES